MKHSLQLKFSQQLTMTPQLQQAIKLLQLSTLDLQQEIQEAVESNPLLEIEELYSEHDDKERSSDTNESVDSDKVTSHDALEGNAVPEELPLDSTWDDYYSASSAPVASLTGSGGVIDDDNIFQGETVDDIQAYLLWQMGLTPFSDTDRAIAVAIIDSIDESGYLLASSEDILQSMQDETIELDEVECVLKRIQMFDPIGSGSRTPQECLLVQLRQFDDDTPFLNEARAIITEHTDLLLSKDYRTLNVSLESK